jgi:hypothetical protein
MMECNKGMLHFDLSSLGVNEGNRKTGSERESGRK